ncbi:MAG: glycosyltransferase family 4 protein [Deltaproteobacteria bacterium]|nr:glycosyltransferase family 4 protein [Deltaproteobacteria bacterium]
MDRNKKILICANSFPPHYGGIAVYAMELSANLAKMPGLSIEVLAPYADGSHPLDSSLPFTISRYNGKLSLYLKFLRLASISDMVFIVQRGNFATFAYWLNRLKKIPYVVVTHGVEPAHKRKRIVSNLNAAAKIIAVSRFVAMFLESIGVERDKILVINNGASIGKANSIDVRRAYNLEGKAVLLTVARLIARKGQDSVIRALPLILKSVPNAHYLVVGDGPERKALENQVNTAGLAGHVTFAGNVPHEKIGGCYNACDLFIMLSRDTAGGVESFGIAYLEAAFAGKAVVAGKGGGTADAVLDGITGIIVDPLDIEEAASAVAGLLLDPEKREGMGENGRKRVFAEFGWETVAKRYASLFQEILAGV